MPRFEPFEDQVFIQVQIQEKTEQGLHLPASYQQNRVNREPTKGLVVEVGPKTVQAKKGSIVLFPPGAGHKVVNGGEEFRFIREAVLLCQINRDDQ